MGWPRETASDRELIARDVDLLHATFVYLKAICAIDTLPDEVELYQPSASLDHAVRRYVQWLPVAAQHPLLAPPVDVLWVWIVHMLAPLPYADDCKRLCGRVIDCDFVGVCAGVPEVGCPALDAATLETSRKVWHKAFPNEPWALRDVLGRESGGGAGGVHFAEFEAGKTDGAWVHYNLRGSAFRQQQLVWNVSRPQFLRHTWMEASVQRYVTFLRLARLARGKHKIVPCYDIDAVWHAHLLFPRLYIDHCTAMCGFVVNHDDGFNDRGGALDTAATQTGELWQSVVGSPYFRPGAMYRGRDRPPNWRTPFAPPTPSPPHPNLVLDDTVGVCGAVAALGSDVPARCTRVRVSVTGWWRFPFPGSLADVRLTLVEEGKQGETRRRASKHVALPVTKRARNTAVLEMGEGSEHDCRLEVSVRRSWCTAWPCIGRLARLSARGGSPSEPGALRNWLPLTAVGERGFRAWVVLHPVRDDEGHLRVGADASAPPLPLLFVTVQCE